ncbi:unnamed protein product [Somion occarium]|uniref:Uncharacterized protein n=1 Tax=Somion occarium TaxID=3059160 RepID=A0ABP1E6G5_9APHY
MSGISVIQTHLSEKLRLLDELGYSDLGMSYKYVGVHSNKDSRHSETHEDMRILDVIAVCLTTGKPGDVVAAAFDKREHLSLVLAKNGDVLPADYAAAQTFFSDLAAATGWTDLLPFLARHGKENLDKRIRNLHESITHFLDDLQSAIEKYPFGAVEKEFPQSRRYFEVRYPDRQPTVDRILNDLIRTCIDESAFEIQDEKTSYIRFVQLILSATILQRSLFLRELTSNSRYLAIKCRAERLERRLGKVCQYMRIGGLIKRVRRLPSIPIRWVADTFTEMGEGRFELCEDPMEAVERVQEGELTWDIDTISKHYPRLRENWARQRIINTCIHAEIRIILHLGRSMLSGSRTDFREAQQPIGCSKRSCLCCTLWINAFNDNTGMLWKTSGSHGKPYDDWALPGTAAEMEGVKGDLVNQRVIKDVDDRLTDQLDWVMRVNVKRTSDEFASSSSQSDASQDSDVKLLYNFVTRARGARSKS